MKYILSLVQFESLGVSSYLDDIVNDVINNLSGENTEYVKNVILHNKNVKIRFVYSQDSTSYKGQSFESYAQLVNPDIENLEYLISIGSLTNSSIIHELKHVDRDVSRDLYADFYYYINHVGRDVIENEKDLFNPDDVNYLNSIFYMVNPDEFEAFYNDIYNKVAQDLKTKSGNSNEIIDHHLKSGEYSDFYEIYFDLYKNGFNLSDYFRNAEDINYFLSLFSLKVDQFIEDDDIGYNNWDMEVNVIDMGKMEKYINKILISAANKGFKKISRIYTIF